MFIQVAGERATPARITVEAVAPAGLSDERVRVSMTATRLTMTISEASTLRDTLRIAIRLATARGPRPVHAPGRGDR